MTILYHVYHHATGKGRPYYYQSENMDELVEIIKMLLWDGTGKISVSETDIEWNNRVNRNDILNAVELGEKLTKLTKLADELGYKLVEKESTS